MEDELSPTQSEGLYWACPVEFFEFRGAEACAVNFEEIDKRLREGKYKSW